MKTTKFNIALLLGAMAFSVYASGQHDLSNDKFQINQVDQVDRPEDLITNSSLNGFNVKIYQDPSNMGNVIMAWKGDAKIDQIRVLTKENEKELNFYIKGEKSLELSDLENGTYYIWFYEDQKVVGVREVKVKLAKDDQMDFNQEEKVDALTDLFNPNFSLNSFVVKIYPNPSLTGKIKMVWKDGQLVDQISIQEKSQGNPRDYFVKQQNELTVDGLENGKYFVKFYYQNKVIGVKQIKVMNL